MNDIPSGTITFLFSYIEGGTRLWEEHPEQMRAAVTRHDAILREIVAANGGHVFKATGDGVAAAFGVASDALAAALAVQLALQSEPWLEPVAISARIGVHTGAAEMRDDDYFGSAVNRCARLAEMGHGGQTLVSEVTQELARDALPPAATLRRLGEHRLRDLTRPETIFQLSHPGITGTFDALRSLSSIPNNLPQQPTSFVGRETVIAEARAILTRTRLLTLTGAGGCGKTRLSLQVAADCIDDYADGVWLVELAALTDPALVPQSVATTVGIREQPGIETAKALMDGLKDRAALLVLDNCEHLLSACATLADALLRSCPSVRIMTTSREPLGIPGERTYRVPPLTLPDRDSTRLATPSSLSPFESVRLFVDRAQSVQWNFSVTNDNAPSLAQLCHRLDGIPLAIELAAARVRAMAVEQINEKLESRFRLLTGGNRTALPRQQTLRSLIDWSYDLLKTDEKILLARLSVFEGGWTIPAAESVCGFAPIEEWDVLDLLTGLADKSLILAEEHEGLNRGRMLETIRQYGVEKLAARGERDAMRERHRRWYLGFAEEAEQYLTGPDQVVWLDRLEREHDNLRAVLDSSVTTALTAGADANEAANAGLRVVHALGRFWSIRGYLSEGRDRVERVLAANDAALIGESISPERQRAIANALRVAGTLAWDQADYARARQMQHRALEIFREIGDRLGAARSLGSLASVAAYQTDVETARGLTEQSLDIYRELDDKPGIANALANLGSYSVVRGDYSAGRELLEASLTVKRQIGDKRGLAVTLGNLGEIAAHLGDYEAARTTHMECLAIRREIGDREGTAGSLRNLGCVASALGDHVTAGTLFAESLALRRAIGDRRGIAFTLHSMGRDAADRQQFAEARDLHAESLRVFHEIGIRVGIALGLEDLAAVGAGEGDVRGAAILWGAVDDLRARLGVAVTPMERRLREAREAPVRSGLSEAEWSAARDEGAAMGADRAVEFALA